MLGGASQAEGYGAGWGSGLAVAVLCLILASRVANVVALGEGGQVPFTVALFVLPLLYAVNGTRQALVGRRWQALAVQAVLTWVPFAVFGGRWQVGSGGLRRAQRGARAAGEADGPLQPRAALSYQHATRAG